MAQLVLAQDVAAAARDVVTVPRAVLWDDGTVSGD